MGNPETGEGVSITPRHGSLLLQGDVLHQVMPKTSESDEDSEEELLMQEFEKIKREREIENKKKVFFEEYS